MRDPDKCRHEWEVRKIEEGITNGECFEGWEKICIRCGVEFDEDLHWED